MRGSVGGTGGVGREVKMMFSKNYYKIEFEFLKLHVCVRVCAH